MTLTEADQFFSKGVKALADGRTISALVQFERALQLEAKPVYSSFFAFCIAKERGLVNRGLTIAEKAVEQDGDNPLNYLNLGKILLLAGRIEDAQRILRDGLQKDRHPLIIAELDRLEVRKRPLFTMLDRDNPLNKYIGKLLARIGLR